MTTKECLRNVRRLKVAINGKCERVHQLRAIAENTTQHLSAMPGKGGSGDRLGAVVACIVDFSNEIATEAASLTEKQREVQQKINALKKQDYRTAMELYYLNGYTWEEVAEKMNYSKRRVLDFHTEALKQM